MQKPPKTNDLFADLETDIDANGNFNPPTAAPIEREKFPCEQCNGSGNYQGVRLHQEKEHCFACKGKGYFYKSYKDRMQARDKAKQSKANKLQNNRNLFDSENVGLYEFLHKNADWSDFARSLAQSIEKYGSLTDRQLPAALNMRAKIEAKRAEKDKERQNANSAANNTAGNLERLAQAFLKGAENLKFPKLRLKTENGLPVVLTRCGSGSKTPGFINITDGGPFGDNRFYGRINPQGVPDFRIKNGVNDPNLLCVITLLREFNDDPAAAIKVQGLRTGHCCVCNRELTDPVSVERGIGPICAERFGF